MNSSNIGPYQPYGFRVQLQTSNLNRHVMFTKYTIINIKDSMTQVLESQQCKNLKVESTANKKRQETYILWMFPLVTGDF